MKINEFVRRYTEQSIDDGTELFVVSSPGHECSTAVYAGRLDISYDDPHRGGQVIILGDSVDIGYNAGESPRIDSGIKQNLLDCGDGEPENSYFLTRRELKECLEGDLPHTDVKNIMDVIPDSLPPLK